jgi:SAM-dependent methyltransferase
MDLREFSLDDKQIRQGQECLNYQPFVLSDSVCTGVAHSWLYSAEAGRTSFAPDFVVEKSTVEPQDWEKFYDANRQLANMYDDFVTAIAEHFPSGSLLDVACNNGYFLTRALQNGMTSALGYDLEDYSQSVAFLNRVVGTKAEFVQSGYDSWKHEIPRCKKYDVVVASNIMQHISDPLYFLAFLAGRAEKALFLFTGMGPSDDFLIHLNEPNKFYSDRKFPVVFDNDVGLSKGLLYRSLDYLGFSEIIELERRDNWLPDSFLDVGNQKALLCLR